MVPKQKDSHTSATTEIINNDDDDNSTKWEFESLSEESLHDKECDVVHMPTPDSLIIQRTTQSSRSASPRNIIHQGGLEEDEHAEGFPFQTLFPKFFPVEVEDDYYEPLASSTFPDTLEEAHVIDLVYATDEPSNEIMTLNPIESFPYHESLSLVHPKLINWDTTKPHHLPHFDTDCKVFIYLNTVEPSRQERMKEENIVRSGINHLNHTRVGQASHNLMDHHQVVANLDKKMETNRSDISQGENPIVAPIDGVIDVLPKHSDERSSILIEPTEPVNLDTK